MSIKNTVISIVLVLFVVVYVTGFLPLIYAKEERVDYILKTLESYEGSQITYELSLDSMKICGEYQWNRALDEHRMRGGVESDSLMSDLIEFRAVLKDNTGYFKMDPVMDQAYKMNFEEVREMIQGDSIRDLIKHLNLKKKLQFEIVSINGQFVGVYRIQGSFDKIIDDKEIGIDFIIYVDGWGHIKKIEGTSQTDSLFTFSGQVQPLKYFTLTPMDLKGAIDF